jgi:hypothetical protein
MSRTAFARLYVAIAALALIATWRQNIWFLLEGERGLAGGLLDFWPALLVNRATTSITVDIFLFGLAAVVWMVVEARRHQVRNVWVYVLLSFVIAISVTFPLFLAAREHRLAALDPKDAPVRFSAGDLLGFAAVGGPIVVFSIYTLVR